MNKKEFRKRLENELEIKLRKEVKKYLKEVMKDWWIDELANINLDSILKKYKLGEMDYEFMRAFDNASYKIEKTILKSLTK